MKQYRGLIIFIATMISLFVFVQIWHRKAAPEEKKLELERQYQGIADVMNAVPPKMPDDSIRLGHISYRDGVINFPYILTQMKKSEIDADAFIAEKKLPLITASCDEKGFGTFIKSGLVVRYTFKDSSDSTIAEFEVGPSDCK